MSMLYLLHSFQNCYQLYAYYVATSIFWQFVADSDLPDGQPTCTNDFVGIIVHAYNPSVAFKMFYLIAPRMQT